MSKPSNGRSQTSQMLRFDNPMQNGTKSFHLSYEKILQKIMEFYLKFYSRLKGLFSIFFICALLLHLVVLFCPTLCEVYNIKNTTNSQMHNCYVFFFNSKPFVVEFVLCDCDNKLFVTLQIVDNSHMFINLLFVSWFAWMQVKSTILSKLSNILASSTILLIFFQ